MPRELGQAARIDSASEFRCSGRLPSHGQGGVATVMLLTFIQVWTRCSSLHACHHPEIANINTGLRSSRTKGSPLPSAH